MSVYPKWLEIKFSGRKNFFLTFFIVMEIFSKIIRILHPEIKTDLWL
jgi:hypothetical protein